MLTEPDILRYSRHVLLREVGGRGQRTLLEARVAVPSLDTAGRACALWLARAGVGVLDLPADRSPAPGTDLAGLLLAADAGRPLIEAVRERLLFQSPRLRFDGMATRRVDPGGDVGSGTRAALRTIRALLDLDPKEPLQRNL